MVYVVIEAYKLPETENGWITTSYHESLIDYLGHDTDTDCDREGVNLIISQLLL